MSIGKLRKRVAIQQEKRISDGAGGYELLWETLATVWADITPVSGHEVVAASGIEGQATHRITMRWRKDFTITTGMRVLYEGRAFNIRYVLNAHEENRWALLLAEEGGAL